MGERAGRPVRTSAGTVRDTGMQVYIEPATLAGRMAGADRPGEHMWVMAAVWHVADPLAARRGELHLDVENLLDVDGPGCFKCEQPYTSNLARKPCRGSRAEMQP